MGIEKIFTRRIAYCFRKLQALQLEQFRMFLLMKRLAFLTLTIIAAYVLVVIIARKVFAKM